MSLKARLLDVENLITPIIEDLGIEFVDVEFKKLHNSNTLIVFIDKEGGVNLSDCEAVSKAIDAPLDEIDFTKGAPYNLNVSSPGLDRPLKRVADFKRNVGNEVNVNFFKGFNGFKTLTGDLVSYELSEDENDILFTLQVGEVAHENISASLATKITPVVKF